MLDSPQLWEEASGVWRTGMRMVIRGDLQAVFQTVLELVPRLNTELPYKIEPDPDRPGALLMRPIPNKLVDLRTRVELAPDGTAS